MKKLSTFFALLLACTTLLAETVNYIDADGQSQSVTATEITNATDTLHAGWYVVKGSNVQTGTLVCNGAVHLILADGAKLVANGRDEDAGIRVSGEGNSLTVYGQTNQSGQLFATGGIDGAGIGGGAYGNGSNITINGGNVTANGHSNGAGIGGGDYGFGRNITINGGNVTAIGGSYASAIGGGYDSYGANIFVNVNTNCIVKADNNNPPTTVIENTGADLTDSFADKRYVTVINNIPVTYGENITISPAFTSGGKIKIGTQITFTAADLSADGYEFIGFYKESTWANPITTGVSGLTYTTTVTETAISVYAKYKYNQHISATYVYPVYNNVATPEQGIKEWKTDTIDATVIVSSISSAPDTWGVAGTTSWYVVTGTDVQLKQGAICQGTVNIILADGAKLTATGSNGQAGIKVTNNSNSLTVYGQTGQSGQLIAYGGYAEAPVAIGGAGIGGGNNEFGSYITINGGTVTAIGEFQSAGIGGGKGGSGSNITINGGTVTATGQVYAAGIGGGNNGSGFNITINGGTVTATGGSNGAGIGGGYHGPGSNITINGGQVMANGGRDASGIGGGNGGSGSSIRVADDLIVRADGNNPPTTIIDRTGFSLENILPGKQYVTVKPAPVYDLVSTTYIDEQGVSHDIDAYKFTSDSEPMIWGVAGQTTWYVVTETAVQLTAGASCIGDVRLILADSAKLTATGRGNLAGIRVSGEGNSLTVYAQSTDTTIMGQLIATGGNYAAGIGGGNNEFGSYITINGGTVTATGGNYAAGIGGGTKGSGSNITINGGTVTANGYAAGIGGGDRGNGSHITINGGTVTAISRGYAAGIGGGDKGNGSYITINGGTVTATGATQAAGIGGGFNGSGSNITINGGTVTATGRGYGAGIGGGSDGSGSNITINGGTVTATGGQSAAGIGCGNGGESSQILVAATHIVKADFTENPIEVVAAAHTITTDIANYLAGRRFVAIEPDLLPDIKANAVDFVNAAISETDSDDIKAIAANAVTAINAAKSAAEVEALKTQALAAIAAAGEAYARGLAQGIAQGDSIGYVRGLAEGIAQGDSIGYARGLAQGIAQGDSIGYARGKAEGIIQGKAELLGAMATPCNDCTAVEVKKDTTTLTLYAPEQVSYLKKEE